MKVFINRMPISGPWGGGNRTVQLLVEKLKAFGYEVVFELEHGIDILFVMDPRPSNYGITYNQILKYKNSSNAKIIQRVGDLGLHSKPHLTSLLELTLPLADHITFISNYAHEFIEKKGIAIGQYSIDELAPPKDFYQYRNITSEVTAPYNIVTHHWSNNKLKGADIYQYLDNHLDFDQFTMTFIGNVPVGVKFKNITHIKPMGTEGLIRKLPEYDFYITGSVLETGGNHVLEAMACGLPVLYPSIGGGIKDYCYRYGMEYDSPENLIKNIDILVHNYTLYKDRVLLFNRRLEDVIQAYINLILEV